LKTENRKLKIEKILSFSKPATTTKKKFQKNFKKKNLFFFFFFVRADALERPCGRGFYRVRGR
jgi:hypothetical protein